MKTYPSVLASTMLLASSFALANTQDNQKTYEATIDPPVGTMPCGFTLSGTVKSPQHDALAYGFFYRPESNLIFALNPHQATEVHSFTGPGDLKIAGSSKDLSDEHILQKHKSLQAQIRVWRWGPELGVFGPGTPQVPALFESAWVDVPLTSPTCASVKLSPDLSAPTPVNSETPSNSAPPAPKPPPIAIKHQTTQPAAKP